MAENAFLTLDDYKALGGADLDAVTFLRLERRSRSLINQLTFDRIKSEQPVRESVRYCTFEIIRMLAAAESIDTSGRTISSQSNDGVSVTYANMSDGERRRKVAETVRIWLGDEVDAEGTRLLYAGVF